MSSFVKDSFINFFSQVIVFCLTVVCSVIIARVLGPEGKGILSMVILIPTTLGILGNMGLDISIIYFYENKTRLDLR